MPAAAPATFLRKSLRFGTSAPFVNRRFRPRAPILRLLRRGAIIRARYLRDCPVVAHPRGDTAGIRPAGRAAPSAPAHVHSVRRGEGGVRRHPFRSPSPEFQSRSASEIARSWDGWVTARDAQIRRRLERGDDDSVINLLLFGSSFTRQPRATAREILTVASQGRLGELIQSPLVQSRIRDLVAGAAAPGDNERLHFVARVMARAAIDPQRYLEAELRRVLAEYDAYARAAGPEQSVQFDDRGLSSDTSIYPGFSIEQALEAAAAVRLLGAGNVRRVAIVGPGLDFTDKREGHDFYPQQTLQPFAVIDSLMRIGLANDGGVSVTTFDLSQRVNDHLAAVSERAQAGDAYVLHLPRNTTASWNPDLTVTGGDLATGSGAPIAPMPTPAGVNNINVRAVRVSAAMALRICSAEIPELRAPEARAADRLGRLILSSPPTCSVDHDVFERSLAVANVAHMLRPGGLFLANNSTPVVLAPSMDSVGYSETIFSSQLNDRDRIDWYRKK